MPRFFFLAFRILGVYPGVFVVSWVQGLGFTDLGCSILGLVLGLGFVI